MSGPCFFELIRMKLLRRTLEACEANFVYRLLFVGKGFAPSSILQEVPGGRPKGLPYTQLQVAL